MFVSILILAVAFTLSQPLYFVTQAIMNFATRTFKRRHISFLEPPKESAPSTQHSNSERMDDHCLSTSRYSEEVAPLLIDIDVEEGQNLHVWRSRLMFVTPLAAICILLSVRPPHFPYAHMSQSLPYTLAEIWYSFDGNMCEAGHFEDVPPFPFQDLLVEDFWESSHGTHVGWRPSGNITAKYLADHYANRPSWLPDLPMQGLERW